MAISATSSQPKSKHSINDIDSPYYLHPSDHTGLDICAVVLKGENYQEWSDAIINAFRAKRKMSFLQSKIPKQVDPDKLEDWLNVNFMMVGWIIRSIGSSLRSSISYTETVCKLWDDLRQRFSVGNGPRVLQLRTDIARCHQSGQSVAAYYGTIKKLWDEISAYVPLRVCTCGLCKCNISDLVAMDREEEQIHQFLIGLDDGDYNTLRSHIMAQEPLPALHRVYYFAVQEERHKLVVKDREFKSDSMALSVQTSLEQSSPRISLMGRESFTLIGTPFGNRRPRRPTLDGRL